MTDTPLTETTKHLIGLLLGAENDWPTAFEALARRLGVRSTTAEGGQPLAAHRAGHASSRSTCATSRGTRWSSTGWPTGTTTRASG